MGRSATLQPGKLVNRSCSYLLISLPIVRQAVHGCQIIVCHGISCEVPWFFCYGLRYRELKLCTLVLLEKSLIDK